MSKSKQKLSILSIILATFISHLTLAQENVEQLENDVWSHKIISETTQELWYRIPVGLNNKILITVINQSNYWLELQINNEDLSNVIDFDVIESNDTFRTQLTVNNTGSLLIKISSYTQPIPISIKFETIEPLAIDVIDLLQSNESAELMEELELLVQQNPNDPLLNLYAAVIRMINIIEAPDEEFITLSNAFDSTFDLFPIKSFDINAASSTTKISNIQEYSQDILLPKIEASLKNLRTMLTQEDFNVLLPIKAPTGDGENKVSWITVDKADTNIIIAGLLYARSAILFFNGFNLGIEPVTFNNRIGDIGNPIDLEGVLIDYPNLLGGEPDIQLVFESAYRNMYLGSEYIKTGLNLIANRSTPQSTHMLYLNDLQEIPKITRYINPDFALATP